ncbi:hypothetical protein OG741_37610 [Streptomyces sp. NBC_01410]|uniref:hypothetical protein n=1 Tax=Streptomyces sp. NBC_01410 TaxID=2903856 RepID=UPI0032432544
MDRVLLGSRSDRARLLSHCVRQVRSASGPCRTETADSQPQKHSAARPARGTLIIHAGQERRRNNGRAEGGRREGKGQYVIDHGDDYFSSLYGRADFIPFEHRLASLAWLRDRIDMSVNLDLAELREERKTGAHRVPGWEGESDLVLDESLITLDTDTRQIGAGIIVVAAVATLESLMNQMLDRPTDERLRRAGLSRKANELATRWPAAINATEFFAHIAWLKDRRNSFAHRLIDEDRVAHDQPCAWTFDDEMADEALAKVGSVARILEEGWERQLTAQG